MAVFFSVSLIKCLHFAPFLNIFQDDTVHSATAYCRGRKDRRRGIKTTLKYIMSYILLYVLLYALCVSPLKNLSQFWSDISCKRVLVAHFSCASRVFLRVLRFSSLSKISTLGVTYVKKCNVCNCIHAEIVEYG